MTTPASTAPTAAEPSEIMIQAGLDAMRTDNAHDSSEQGRVRRIYLAMEEVRFDCAASLVPSTAPSAEVEGLIAELVEQSDYHGSASQIEHTHQIERAAKSRDAARAALTAHCEAQDRRIANLVTELALAELRVPEDLVDDDVEWVVNDNAELGVKIKDRFFFCYKGQSLAYVDGKHDDGSPIKWRPVFKREFGECVRPINYRDHTLQGTVSLDDSDKWQDLPAMPEETSSYHRLRAQIAAQRGQP